MGYATTLDYVEAASRAILTRTGMMPHINAGLMGEADLLRCAGCIRMGCSGMHGLWCCAPTLNWWARMTTLSALGALVRMKRLRPRAHT